MRTDRRYRSITAKIKSRSQLSTLILHAKKAGRKVVFTNGCFDIIHYGHAHYLENARNKGDLLVVAVNSDKSVKKIKGPRRPIVPQKDRASVIAALESVDYVTVFNEPTPLALIKLLKPDVLVKGADWDPGSIVGAQEVTEAGGIICTIALSKGRSTTSLIEKIVKTHRA